VTPRDGVPLAPLTTLGLGGPARHFVAAPDDETLVEALRWADARGLPVLVLGGGSNLVVGDAGFDGLAIQVATRGVAFGEAGRVTAAAGEPWDALVAATVGRELAGLECLSGIPGLVGATPIQNVGAYGQEVAETIRAVRVVERGSWRVHDLSPEACGFGYRDSAFKRDPERFVVLGVTFGLRPGGAPTLRYRELADAVKARELPTLAETRQTVLALRAAKSMVVRDEDPNRRSVGSFFTNPIVSAPDGAAVAERSGAADAMPRWPAPDGRVKLSAGWLIERAGFVKGLRRGSVGISSAHALALVHHGGGTTVALLTLAREIRDGVRARFGVTLVPEPTLVGIDWDGHSPPRRDS
jgi:UDP-N-acetylmuramate dehydrogenase